MELLKAVFSGPGPQTKKEFLFLILKGMCMGTADIIPGVSGGTIAFVTGIYEQILAAIASVNLTVLKKFFTGHIKEALSLVHFRFLIPLIFGILFAILSSARIIHHLITDYPVPTWGTFMGLIAASIIVIGKELEEPTKASNLTGVAVGAAIAYGVVSLIPVSTPEDSWFIFICGMIGICAMILPGLSGSFLLLILGKYEFITGAVKAPFAEGNFPILIIFLCGCAVGIAGFSRILRYFLNHHHQRTMAILTGIMIGAMKKVWPWKEVLETKIVRGKTLVLREQNILPGEFNTEVALTAVLIVIGFILVLVIDRIANNDSDDRVQV